MRLLKRGLIAGTCALFAGCSYAQTADLVHAEQCFNELLQMPVEDFSDLYLDVVQEYVRLNQSEKALPFVDKLKESPAWEELPDQWASLAETYQKAGQPNAAVQLYEVKLQELGMQDAR